LRDFRNFRRIRSRAFTEASLPLAALASLPILVFISYTGLVFDLRSGGANCLEGAGFERFF